MTKNCRIRIEGADEEILLSEGRFHEKDGRCYVFFEVQTENGSEKCSLKYDTDSLEYNRKGAMSVSVSLKSGQKTQLSCTTPYGGFTGELQTKQLLITEEPETIRIHAEYLRSLDGGEAESCRIRFEIKAREDG